MHNKFIIIFISSLFLLACSKNNEIKENNQSFPVLSYDAEISETLNLDPSNILVDEPRENNYWFQHF